MVLPTTHTHRGTDGVTDSDVLIVIVSTTHHVPLHTTTHDVLRDDGIMVYTPSPLHTYRWVLHTDGMMDDVLSTT